MALKKDKIMLANGFPTLPDFDAMETGEATKQDIYYTQGIIAYVQKTLKADKAYTVGDDDSFIYNGKLYRLTENIAKDATIVLEGAGANAELADGIQDQIDATNGDMSKIRQARPYVFDTGWTVPALHQDRLTIQRGGYKTIGHRVFIDILASVDFAIDDQYYTGFNFYDVLKELPAPIYGLCSMLKVDFLTYSSENEKYSPLANGKGLLYKATGNDWAWISIAADADIATTDNALVHIVGDYDIN